jgi:hypothetical protein
MILIIAGALNYILIYTSNKNVIESVFQSYTLFVYVLIGAAALYIMFDRDTYLPFLGRTIIPCDIFDNKTPENATTEISFNLNRPNAKVIYWASEPSTDTNKIVDYKEAYGQFLNSGIATSDANGNITLKVRPPQPYRVPIKGVLEPHIHFRICEGLGTLGRVKTIFLSDKRIK